MSHVLRDDQMFGPSSFGGKPSINFADLMKAPILNAPKERGPAPFRTGQFVRQVRGVMPLAGRHEVEDVKYVTDGTFKGWAIRLVGRPSPYAAELFEAIGERVDVATVTDESPVRVVFSIEQQAYQVYVDDVLRLLFSEADMLRRSGQEIAQRIEQSGLPLRICDKIARMLTRAAGWPTEMTAYADGQSPADAKEAAPKDSRAPTPARPTFLQRTIRRIIRPKKDAT